MGADLMAIGELARQAGVPTSTVRHYEREALIEPDLRESGQRRYTARSLRRLVFIGLLQDAGLSLRDIRGVLDASSVTEWKAIGQARLEVLEAEIARLEHARTYLRGALLCRFDHPLTDCDVMSREIDRRIDDHVRRDRGSPTLQPMQEWDGPDLDAWDAWTPWEAAERFADVGVPWCVVGGWAIDLFVGEQTREHEDLEVAFLRRDFGVARTALGGVELFTAGSGEVRALGHDEAPPRENHQVWALDVQAQRWRIDVMLEHGDADTWSFRRDRSITAPRSFMVERDRHGVPYLAPHGTLLYKAKVARDKDEADLATCLPRMEVEARAWLRTALEHAHPEHPWIRRLT